MLGCYLSISCLALPTHRHKSVNRTRAPTSVLVTHHQKREVPTSISISSVWTEREPSRVRPASSFGGREKREPASPCTLLSLALYGQYVPFIGSLATRVSCDSNVPFLEFLCRHPHWLRQTCDRIPRDRMALAQDN